MSASRTVRNTQHTESVTVGGLLAGLWRARLRILLPTLLVMAAAIAYVMTATPTYRSATKILIEDRETAFTRPEGESASSSMSAPDEAAIRSHVEQLDSRDLVVPVIEELGLADRREFNPALDAGLMSTLRGMLGMGGANSHTMEERVEERFYEKLAVYQIGKSRVIAVEFTSRDPRLAAEVANRISDRFLTARRDAKREDTRDASQWLASQIETLRQRVAEAEKRVADFRAEKGLFEVGGGQSPGMTLSAQQLGELSSELTQARAQRSEATARARLIRDALQAGKPIDANDVLNSQLIQRLMEEEVRLRAQIAELSSTLLPQHPRMKELNAQLRGLSSQIRGEAERVVRGLENEARIAADREQELQSKLDALKGVAATTNQDEIELRAREREAAAQRELLENYLSRYREAVGREEGSAAPADARIIARAVPSSIPYFPRKAPVVAMATAATLIFACGINILSQLGAAAGAARRRSEEYEFAEFELAETEIVERPVDPAPVAHRADTAPEASPAPAAAPRQPVAASAVEKPAAASKLVLVTAVRRTSDIYPAAVRLARSCLSAGGRAIVVDCEFGGRNLERAMGFVARAGLGELLAGNAAYSEIIHRDGDTGVHMIPAGGIQGDPAALAGSEAMQTFLDALAQTYGTVVLVAAPIAFAPETPMLARRAGRAVLVANAGCSQGAIGRARGRLLEAGIADITTLGDEPSPAAPVPHRPRVLETA
ncbi:MAG: GumC family protein [Flavobacteriaceae bacterium]